MTKRYKVEQNKTLGFGAWDVNVECPQYVDWVATFESRFHADRFAAELNREEEARQQAASDGALLSASLQASMQINQAMQRQYEQMLRELSPAVMERPRAFTQHKALTLEDVVKASNAVFGPKHKDAIPPPAPRTVDELFGACADDVKDEPYVSPIQTGEWTFRSSVGEEPKPWNLSNIVDTTTLPPGWEQTEDGYKYTYTAHTPTFVKLTGIREPEKHPTDGERVRCCRAHADPVFMFNDEVWRSLKERCDG